jgi:glycosyltransferase involved in cell wall biosynthesis
VSPTKLAYLTLGFPGPRAGTVHIARMLEAFMAEGCETALLRPYRWAGRRLDVGEYVRGPLAVETLPTWPFDRSTPRLYTAGLLVAYRAWLARQSSRKEFDWFHTRDQRLAVAAARALEGRALVAFEVHHSAATAAQAHGIDLFVAISRAVADGLARAGVSPDRIVVAHDAVDPSRFATADGLSREVRERWSLGDRFVVGYTGHLYRDRGIGTLLRAVMELPSDVVLLVVGGTDHDLARSRAEADQLGVGDRVRWAGLVHPDRVPAYQLACDALVVPYGADYELKSESSPLKLHEYMAAGKPIVVGDLPFAREIVDSTTASLVPPDDPSAYARAIEGLRQNPRAAAEMAGRAHRVASENTWSRRARTILAAGEALR